MISKLLKSFEMLKIKWQENLAHQIAKFSFYSRSKGLLVSSIPPNVVAVVMDDCKHILIN